MSLTKTQIANRNKLTTALRSGKYKQAKGRLRDTHTNGFCCQGVGCDLVNPNKWTNDNDGRAIIPYWSWNGHDTSWPEEVREHYGFSYGDSDTLMTMNDGMSSFFNKDNTPFSFAEIADAIDYLTLAGIGLNDA